MNEENKFSEALQFGCLIKAFPSLQYTDLKKNIYFYLPACLATLGLS